MVLAQPRDRGDAVDERHVQVDHDRVRVELVGELDRVEAVLGGRRRRSARAGARSAGGATRGRRASSSASRTRTGAPSAAPSADHQARDVSLAAVSVQPAERQVAVIGAPLDLGAGRRGVDMGPSAIRYAELEPSISPRSSASRRDDLGNVEAPVAESTARGRRARALPAADPRAVRSRGRSSSREARPRGHDAARARRRPLRRARLARRHGVELHGPGGVIWVDAHGDLNTPETSPSGNVHGMVLAAALGLGGDAFAYDGWTLPAIESGAARARRGALARRRRAGAAERLDAKVFTMSEVDRLGIEPCMREALDARGGRRLPAREPRHGRRRSRVRARRRHAGARRPLVPRGAPRDGDRRGVGLAGLARRRRGEPGARPRERDRRSSRSSSSRRRSARGSSRRRAARKRSTASATSSKASHITMCMPGTAMTSAWPAYAASCSSRTSPYAGAWSRSVGARSVSGGGGSRCELAEDRDDGRAGTCAGAGARRAGTSQCSVASSSTRSRGVRPSSRRSA